MAAPRRRPIKSTPTPNSTTQPAASALSGGISTHDTSSAPIMTVVQPNATIQKDDLFLMKMSQVVMMGIGFLAIWGGIFSVAFDEDATNDNFLVLFVGGLASFAVSVGLIELQSKKNQHRLYDIQNYFLGIAFFFSTVGVLWGTRYLMGLATGTLELDWFGNPAQYTEKDWSPNANGIYAQTLTCLLLTYGHYRLLKRYSGDTSFGWGVATYAPMAVLIAGVGPWIRWSENVVSWELGLAIISITFVSMEMSLRSNKALNFVVVAFAGGLVPIIYETLNTNAPADGAGGALSLMVFIIGLQGYYAARQDLRKEVMERASLLLIGQVVVAIALARIATDFNLILGPFRAGDFASLEPYINIPVALWCAVLFAYFPAVLQQRVPWMPIGLAAALFVLPMSSSTIPWVLSMLVLPYMIFISKVARAWVVNATMLVFSASYLLTDWWGYANDVSTQNSFGGGWLHVALPLFLVAVAELGRHREKLQTSTSLAMIGAVVLSRAILDPEWYLPWLLVAYMLAVNWNMVRSTSSPTMKQRQDATLALVFTSLTVLLLAVLDNLSLPPTSMFDSLTEIGFRPQFIVLFVALYLLANASSAHELDVGSIFKWLSEGDVNNPSFDSTTGTWVVKEKSLEDESAAIEGASWTPLARFSLLASLCMFTFSISSLDASIWEGRPYVVLLLLLPVALLVREVLKMEEISSATRAGAVALLLFLAAPLSIQIGNELWSGNDVFYASVLLDSILVAAPLFVNTAIARRGLDEASLNRNADAMAYLLLLLLALLDTSGGLLLLPIVTLVAVRTVKHAFQGLTVVIPITFLIPSTIWYEEGLLGRFLTSLPAELTDYFMNQHSGPFFAIIGIFVATHMGMALFTQYTRRAESESGLYAAIAVIWLSLGLLSALPDGYWIPTIATLTFMVYLWNANKSQALPYTLGLLYMALFLGFSLSNTFQPITDGEAAGWSGVLTGVGGIIMALLHQQGRLFKVPAEDEEEQRSHDDTAALAVQIGALGFVAGYDVFYGVGPFLGFIMLCWSALRKGQANSLLLLPILLTFSVYNFMVQTKMGDGDLRTTIMGASLAIQGILLTVLSTKDDTVYDWESLTWESDEVFFDFMDRLGIAGLLYTIVGVFVALNNINLESVAYLLMTVYLVIIGIQGFSEENDARWRRGLGGYGATATSFLFANSLESSLYGAIGFVLMGMVALGFGFLFMQRMNEEDGIYVEMTPSETEPSSDAPLELDEEDSGAAIASAEHEQEETESSDEEHEEEDSVPEAMEDNTDEEDAEETAASPTSEALEEESIPEPVLRHSGLLTTGEGFSLRLPAEAVENIIATLKTTPHAGYLPVVAFGPSGQIMLTFEESKTA